MKKASALATFGAVFGVAAVLFGSHAGGGFATGNQEVQFYVKFGWLAPVTAILAMALLTLTLREAIVMYNNNDCKNYKDLFTTLFHPYPKLEILWEIYYYLMVIIAVGAVISGAAGVFQKLGVPYFLAVIIVGIVLLLLTIFGAKVVTGAAGIMSIVIMVCCFTIFISGIIAKSSEISTILSETQFWGDSQIKPFLLVFVYAGFQSVVIPSLTASSRELLRNEKQATASMFLSFIMNAVALCLAVIMLLGWYSNFAGTDNANLPTLFVAQSLNNSVLTAIYVVALVLCLLSTGVACIFGLVNRFEDHKGLSFLKTRQLRRVFVALAIMLVGMGVSSFGLTKVVKYGYGNCGYLGIAVIILPFLTVGVYKNRKFKKEHPDHKWAAQRIADGEEVE